MSPTARPSSLPVERALRREHGERAGLELEFQAAGGRGRGGTRPGSRRRSPRPGHRRQWRNRGSKSRKLKFSNAAGRRPVVRVGVPGRRRGRRIRGYGCRISTRPWRRDRSRRRGHRGPPVRAVRGGRRVRGGRGRSVRLWWSSAAAAVLPAGRGRARLGVWREPSFMTIVENLFRLRIRAGFVRACCWFSGGSGPVCGVARR